MKKILFLSLMLIGASSLYAAEDDMFAVVEKKHDTYVSLIQKVLADAPSFQERGADWEIRTTLDGILEDTRAFRESKKHLFASYLGRSQKMSWIATETQLDSIRHDYRTLEQAQDADDDY